MLLDLKKSWKISDFTHKMLCSSDSSSSRFYGLAKIHKPGIPLSLLLILGLMQFLVILLSGILIIL